MPSLIEKSYINMSSWSVGMIEEHYGDGQDILIK